MGSPCLTPDSLRITRETTPLLMISSGELAPYEVIPRHRTAIQNISLNNMPSYKGLVFGISYRQAERS